MKNIKKSFLMSSISLLLCFIMLLGTTFAWFTDSVTSSGNKIQAGNLKLDLEMLNKETGAYESIKTSKDPIFNYNLWEPGYTDVKFLKVENEGSLSLKWKAMFVSDEEVSKLAEVIDVYVLPSVTELGYDNLTRDFDGWRRVGTLDQFINTLSETTYGNLLPYSCAYLGIALHMQESAGNEYQEIGLEAFDIQIVATQMSNEEDSFGPDYDNDAEWPAGEMSFRVPFSFDDVATINGELAEDKVVVDPVSGAYAIIPAGTKIVEGVEPYFSGNGIGNSGTFSDEIRSYDIHIEGIAPDNTKPITVFIGKILPAGLGETELKLYHEDVQMTRVNSVEDFAINNQFTYDAETGAVVLYVTNFSVFSGVKTTPSKWEDNTVADTSWYVGHENDEEYVLADVADFLGFRDLVDAGNTFAGKTVKLGTDIDLNGKLFNPIGYGYAHNGGQAFMGTFDGQQYTIYNLYQNGWELDYSYGTQGGGLFASIKDATIKNLAISGANIVMECVDMGILVGYAQGECHFENIVVTKSTIANYNRYTGGLVGEVCKGVDNNGDGFTHTFNNIIIDSSVVVSSLWGSFDTSCGGVIGGKWGDAKVSMTDVTVAAELDVYSDVTAAYQWYAYRRCGMLIGHTEIDSPKKGLNVHEIEFLTCENVEVIYGDWVNYNYYEFNDQESDTGRRYPWVRAEESPVGNNGAFSNPRYGVPTYEGKKVTDMADPTSKSTAHAAITFNQLYGGGQGVYGKADHTNVKINNLNETKTIYFQNTSGWTDLKLMYHYKAQNGNTWTTVVEGISLGDPIDTKGVYPIYKVTVPADAYSFTITDGTNSTPEIKLEGLVAGDLYYVSGNTIGHRDYTGQYKTVYFQNNWLWSDVSIYYWYADNSYDVAYPGTQMKVYSNEYFRDIYYFYVPADASGMAISGKNSGVEEETVDIKVSEIKDDKVYYLNAKSGNKVTVSVRDLDTCNKIYFDPANVWSSSSYRFAAYFFNSTSNTWVDMTDADGDGIYECEVPKGYDSVIFCQMKKSSTSNNWTNKNSQTYDLGIYEIYFSSSQTYTMKLQLIPNSNWQQASPRYAAYFMDANKSKTVWVSMTYNSASGTYEVEIPEGTWKYVIFVRMNPSNSTNDWGNKWTQTGDLTIPTTGNYIYTIDSSATTSGNTNSAGSWSKK